jgi:hypothetical protein
MADMSMALEQCQDCGSSQGEMLPFTGMKGTPKGKGYLCLDCAVKFANKKIVQSYIAAAIGVALGIWMIIEQRQHHSQDVFAAILTPYLFWATFFGWHYGGRLWPSLGKLSDHWIFGIILFSFRLTFAMIVGMFGGGIAQFLTYRKIIKQKMTQTQS